ncbi:Pre-mRNA-splicing factor 38 [Astathelohania contejeani]|uniref:Pre-mRNA-splicing factor 38 n=1 Tax=Astathelohania contejeani TaxID=164912 RepID=A0ABQ7I019_9MICR|nr:Pre-mRNA-splicing factor 38 [Thelohania contejeani]
MKYQIISKILREKILIHPKYQEIKNMNFDQLKKEMCKLGCIGCVVFSRPHAFLLLLQRLEAINLPEEQIIEELNSYYNMKGSKYVLILLAFYIKLSYKYNEYKLLKPFLNDYRKIVIVTDNNQKELTYVDVIVEKLLVQKEYLGLFLNPFG